MKAIPANTRAHHWKTPEGSGSFRPNGPKTLAGRRTKANPELWSTDEPVYAARLFVGFNVGGAPQWSMDDLVTLVERLRRDQGRRPDSSFLAQRGIYTSDRPDGGTVTENGAQIVIINAPDPASPEIFQREMINLAEDIARELEQEAVVLEIQKDGMTQKTYGIGP